MATISSLRISGIWGDSKKNAYFTLDPKLNFIIGVNGTGKTTIINLLAAALRCDIQTLKRIKFSEIEIKLSQPRSRKIPSILVKKDLGFPSDDFAEITYYIRESASSPAEEINLSRSKMGRHYEDLDLDAKDTSRQLLFLNNFFGDGEPTQKYVTNKISKIVNSSWLSVHRSAFSEGHETKSYDSTVDIKLRDIKSELIKYFSNLDKQSLAQQNKFQESMFLALLYEKRPEKVILESLVKDIDEKQLSEEKKNLEDIFSQFKIDPKKTSSRLEQHFIQIKEAMKRWKETKSLSTTALNALVLNGRLEALIDEWTATNQKKEEILQPQTIFLSVLNSMLLNKKATVSTSNEIMIIREDKNQAPINIEQLSSGEKQLLIVLGQALLQQSKPWVYIADEPEISLHVRWQECLVDNIKKLNPHAQIIFATHSPDIVGKHSKHIHDMENIL